MKRLSKKPSRQVTLEAFEPRVLLSSYVVDTSLDETVVNATTSLREAIVLANGNAGADTITFDAALNGSTITLGGTEMSITESLTITGPGAANLTVAGGGTSRIFSIAAGGHTVGISGLTLSGGAAGGASDGGAIYNNGGLLTVTSCTISGNSAAPGTGFGGGIANVSGANLVLTNSTISGNTAGFGAGLSSDGSVTNVSGSTISGNTAAGGIGGGIYTDGGIFVLSNSTVSGNSSPFGGGIIVSNGAISITASTISGNSGSDGAGIFSNTSTVTLTNSTLSGNTGTGQGSGAFVAGGTFTIRNSTVTLNTSLGAGAGIDVDSGTATLVSTIVAGNLRAGNPDDIAGTVAGASANNLVGDAGTAGGLTNGVNSNIVGANPLLGALANNGGSTLTHALQTGSPAINGGSNPSNLTTDQRGGTFGRTRGTAIDIGSFEYSVAPATPTLGAAPATIVRGASVTLTATGVTDEDGTIARVDFYRDINANGVADSGELIGSDNSATGGYTFAYAPGGGVGTGTVPVLAVTVDNDSLSSAVGTASFTLEAAPAIGTFGAAPATILRGASVTLTAGTVTDEDGTIARVDFYRDANNNGVADSGELIGSDNDSAGGYTFVFAPGGAVPTGTVAVLAVAVDDDAHSSAPSTANFTLQALPSIGLFGAAPNIVLRGASATLTAAAMTDEDGTIARVDFYRDANNNGVADSGELIGSDSDATGGYTFVFAPGGAVPTGTVALLAIAVDNDGNSSLPASANFTLRAAPVIGTFTANPSTVQRGQTTTLTAGGVTDEDGTIARVDFYFDANGNSIADSGEIIGTDNDGSNGYGIAYVPGDTTPLGHFALLAVAVDNHGNVSAPSTAALNVGALPVIGSLNALPTPTRRGQTVTVTATGVADADGVVMRVDFYRDINGNGVAEAGELIGSDNVGSDGYSTAFVPGASVALGTMRFLAVAVDNNGLSSAVRSATATLGATAPTVGSLGSSTSSFGPGDAVTLTAGTVADADGTVSSVSFYVDSNGDGLIDPGELLGTDTDGSNGYSWTLTSAQSRAMVQGARTFIAAATDNEGTPSATVNTAVTVLFSVRAGSGRTLAGAATNGTNTHFVVTINTAGAPIAFSQGTPWAVIDLSAATGAPAAIGDAVSWVDPKDNLTYAAYPSAAGLILLRRASDGVWSFRNLSTELGITTSPTERLVQFTSNDQIVVIAGFTSTGRMVAFKEQLPVSTGGPTFQFVDISADLDAQGMQAPTFGSITSFVTAWNTWHLVGIDQSGQIQVVWIDPSQFTQWRTDNLSAAYGAPPIQGQLAVTLTPWAGINLTGLDSSGHLLVTWWVPGNDWINSDLTVSASGVALAGSSLTGYGTPWGGMNYVGTDSNGQVVGYWWSPNEDRWDSGPFLPSGIPADHLPTGALTSYSSNAGTLNVLGTSSNGDALRLWWEPTSTAWAVDDLTEIAVRS